MKTILRELASDALKLIDSRNIQALFKNWLDKLLQEATVQEEAAASLQSAVVDSQNNNGNLSLSGLSDEGSCFDIDGTPGPEDGDALENWPNTKETLRSISPELPQLEGQLWYENLRLEAKNMNLKAENTILQAMLPG